MIKEIEYKRAYNLYRAGSNVLLGTFKSRKEAVDFNHKLMLDRARVLQKLEAYNAKFKGSYPVWSAR